MTSGNLLKIYNTKKIKSITGMIETDSKTSWLWILSFLGIGAFPPAILFISEFLIIKTMIQTGHYWMTFWFMLLLTIILYGLINSVICMCSNDKKEHNKVKLSISMYLFVSLYK